MKPILLIVDDEQATRNALRMALEERYEIFTAANLRQAKAVLASEPVELVLTDLRLAGDSGMDVLAHARTLPKPPQCIMMTAYGSVDTAVEAMKRGAYTFVTKPLNLDEVEMLLLRAHRTVALEEENKDLQTRLEPTGGLDKLLGKTEAMEQIFQRIRRVAPSKTTVLIEGESGTGKELVARAIHTLSGRPADRFVAVNCAALSPQLLESELFGHERGAFTGATQRRIGRFEQASGGTLFLDEIGEIDPSVQVKLLRVLAEKSIERVGSNTAVPVDVRVVAATNKHLEHLVSSGLFREDLFFRLSVVEIHMPPLRERQSDIVLMAQAFLKEFCTENAQGAKTFSRAALDALLHYAWPGNVRQLRTAVEHGVIMSEGPVIGPEDLPGFLSDAQAPAPASSPLVDFELEQHPEFNLQCLEKRTIREALAYARGSRTQAAELLGISRRTLQRKLSESPDLTELSPTHE